MSRPDTLIVGSDDPLSSTPGGWHTMMRGFLAVCSEPERYAIAAPDWGVAGAWSEREFEGRRFPYFRLFGDVGPLRSKRARAALAVARHRRELGGYGVVYSHAPEILVPFLAARRRPRAVLHVLADLDADVVYSRAGSFRGRPFQLAYRRLAYATMRRCDPVLWVNQAQLESAPRDVQARSQVLGTFHDDRMFTWVDRSGRSSDPLLVAVGKLMPVKRLDRALRALALAAVSGQRWRLAVCGSGPEEGRLRLLASELGVEDRVEWHTSFLEQSELAALLASADIGLLVSETEGSPTVVKEMLGSGLPVVVSDVGDARAVVGDRGIVLESAEPAAIEAAVRSLLARRAEARTASPKLEEHALATWVRRFEGLLAG